MSGIRIGILGAARIAPIALVRPARLVPEVTVTAIAARDRARAARFARKHGIPVVHDSYDRLIHDPDLDAVYIPLPNGLHANWTGRAIEAGKHVLCEKPFTANAEEAEQIAKAAAASNQVVMEAFHYRYHPLASRMRAIMDSGELGEIQEIQAWLCFPEPRFDNIRYQYDLAGGATMDAGCYPLNCLRLLGPGEPEVVRAVATLLGRDPRVDRAMTAELRFPTGARGRITCSMWSRTLLRIAARAVGTRGEMRVFNFVLPQAYNRLTVKTGGRTHRERVRGEASYTGQLRAFAAAVLTGAAFPTTAEDAVQTMRLIDDIYRAAGLTPRGT